MAYDDDLADRIAVLLDREDGITQKRMFGGLAFLTEGRMAVACNRAGGMMVRVAPADAHDLLEREGVERMVMRGSEMRGWLSLAAGTVTDDEALREWVARGLACARTFPPKS